MSIERRKSRRMDLSVAVELKQIANQAEKKSETVQVVNLSKSGVGFESDKELNLNECYNTEITIWTKETIPAIIKIIRKDEENGVFTYGGLFVGMTNAQAIKIDIYDMLHED